MQDLKYLIISVYFSLIIEPSVVSSVMISFPAFSITYPRSIARTILYFFKATSNETVSPNIMAVDFSDIIFLKVPSLSREIYFFERNIKRIIYREVFVLLFTIPLRTSSISSRSSIRLVTWFFLHKMLILVCTTTPFFLLIVNFSMLVEYNMRKAIYQTRTLKRTRIKLIFSLLGAFTE